VQRHSWLAVVDPKWPQSVSDRHTRRLGTRESRAPPSPLESGPWRRGPGSKSPARPKSPRRILPDSTGPTTGCPHPRRPPPRRNSPLRRGRDHPLLFFVLISFCYSSTLMRRRIQFEGRLSALLIVVLQYCTVVCSAAFAQGKKRNVARIILRYRNHSSNAK